MSSVPLAQPSTTITIDRCHPGHAGFPGALRRPARRKQQHRKMSAPGLLRCSHRVQVAQCDAFIMLVAGLAVDGSCGLTGGDGLVEPAHLAQEEAEVIQRAALAAPHLVLSLRSQLAGSVTMPAPG
jgi:hypothetical protein